MASDDFFRLIRAWLTVYLPRSRRLSPHTIRSYKTALNLLLTYLRHTRGLGLEQIGFDQVDRAAVTGFTLWLTETKQASPATVNQRLAAIKSFMAFCAGEDPALIALWLQVKQARPARVPARAPDALAMPAVEALIAAPGQNTRRGIRDTTLILLIFDAAARVQEVLDLTVGDVNTTPRRGTLTITGKGQKTRIVPIMDKTGRHLDQYIDLFHPGRPAPDALLFYTTRAGQHQKMSQDNVSYLLNKHATTARPGCPELPEHVHAHQLRHARAMQMLRAGVPLPHIKEFLGHADITTTSIYATADNQMVRDAVQRAASSTPEPVPIWKGDDEMILQLAALT
jgi:site-specific recombinase XerD